MKLTRYIALNGVFVVSIYFGLFKGVNGFINLALFMGWFTAVTSFMLLFDVVIKEAAEKMVEPRTVPEWFDVSFDLCVSAAFIYHGYYVLAVFYILHIGNLQTGRKKAVEFLDNKD